MQRSLHFRKDMVYSWHAVQIRISKPFDNEFRTKGLCCVWRSHCNCISLRWHFWIQQMLGFLCITSNTKICTQELRKRTVYCRLKLTTDLTPPELVSGMQTADNCWQLRPILWVSNMCTYDFNATLVTLYLWKVMEDYVAIIKIM